MQKNCFTADDIDRLGDITHLIVPDGVVEIESAAFQQYTEDRNYKLIADERGGGWWDRVPDSGITKVTLPDSMRIIGERAFENMICLQEIDFGNSIKSIGEWAFANCSLRLVVLPNCVTHIGQGAFAYCHYLQSVRLPNGLTEFPEDLFYGVHSLEELYIPDSVMHIDEGFFTLLKFWGAEESVTIFCKENSTAHRYAVEHKMPFKLM